MPYLPVRLLIQVIARMQILRRDQLGNAGGFDASLQ